MPGLGLGLDACHIVPQKHYYLYPPGPPLPSRITDPLPTDMESLGVAWISTWNRQNGILLFSHLHQMFDARLFAITGTPAWSKICGPGSGRSKSSGRYHP